LENKNSGRGSQGVCHQDEMIGGKPPVGKELRTQSSEQKSEAEEGRRNQKAEVKSLFCMV
jgi:hypothetical protein